MPVFRDKNEFIFDVDLGLCGTLSRVEDSKTEDGYVYIYYYPIGQFPPKEHKYLFPVQRSKMFPLYGLHTEIPGVEKKILLINQGKLVRKDSLIDLADKQLLQENEELKMKIKDLEIEVMQRRQEAEDAKAGAEKQITRSMEISKAGRKDPNDPRNNPLLGGGFRRFDDI